MKLSLEKLRYKRRMEFSLLRLTKHSNIIGQNSQRFDRGCLDVETVYVRWSLRWCRLLINEVRSLCLIQILVWCWQGLNSKKNDLVWTCSSTWLHQTKLSIVREGLEAQARKVEVRRLLIACLGFSSSRPHFFLLKRQPQLWAAPLLLSTTASPLLTPPLPPNPISTFSFLLYCSALWGFFFKE